MNTYEFFIAGRARNKEKILKICDIFDKYNIPYYCFLKNEESYGSYGEESQGIEEKQQEFEKLGLKSPVVLNIFSKDMEAEKKSNNLLLVLPAGKSGHIEAGVAYGLGKKCYAIGEFDATDSLYNIFEQIFLDEEQLNVFLANYNKNIIEIRFDKDKKQAIAYDNNIIIGECDYIETEEYWDIIHTEVNNLYQGQGIAKKLVKCIIENADKNNKKITAQCSYAKKVIENM